MKLKYFGVICFLWSGFCVQVFAQTDSSNIGPQTGGLSQPGVSSQPTYGSNVSMDMIENQINILASYINTLQNEINIVQSTPGPQGPGGPTGAQGAAGSSANIGGHGAVTNITSGPCGGFIVYYGDGTSSTVMTSAGCDWR